MVTIRPSSEADAEAFLPLAQTHLAEWLGGESPMLAFLQGTGSLSLPQIERLREHLGIPANLLLSSGKAPNPRLLAPR